MSTPFFPAWRRQLAPMGSRSASARRKLEGCTLSRIEERFAPALEAGLLQKPARKAHSRQRLYPLALSFWCWIWQILQGRSSCREVVRQVQALHAAGGGRRVESGTAAYCRARGKLPLTLLEKILAAVQRAVQRLAPGPRLLQGRRIKVADGSSVRLPDTPENRAAYPPAKNQSRKPLFPMMKLVALMGATTGAVLAALTGNCHHSELRLFLGLHAQITAGDVITADRHFGCYLVAAWLQGLKADLIARVSTRNRNVDFRKAQRKLGPLDALFVWRKPAHASPLLTPAQWAALPAVLSVRLIRRRIAQKGFRTREITLVTTLVDPALYPAHEVMTAYLKRWRMELCLDDLKTTLGMEMLSCLKPEGLHRELLCYLIAHNLLRWLMLQAARQSATLAEDLSFTGTLDAFRHWSAACLLVRGPDKKRRLALLWRQFLTIVGGDRLPYRPGRRAPRAVKKRSKYPPLCAPRALYRDRKSRTTRRRIANAKRKRLK